MAPTRTAYMPLDTYPEAVADATVEAAVGVASSLAGALRVTTFAVDIPHVPTGLGSLFLDVPGLVHTTEEKSRAECRRLAALVQAAAQGLSVACAEREVVLGAAHDAAAAEARYADLAVLPWAGGILGAQEMAQAVVFGSGRPTVLVPAGAPREALGHLAVAWDGSRVAARALHDALPLLAPGGRITVLTVADEAPLKGPGLASRLAEALAARGLAATPREVPLGGREIAAALQDAALAEGARLLAMGGFGHSRLRDFVLGGATKGVLTDLRLPVLLSH